MTNQRTSWFFVDDATQEANAFAQALSDTGRLKVEVLAPKEAREKLLTGQVNPLGVLMDVDLSNAVDELGTGPGMAQDLRVKQRSGKINEFPVVRFAGAEPIKNNILGDPSSDDLFDAKIPKERVYADLEDVCNQLNGVESVYQALAPGKGAEQYSIASLVELDQQAWEKYGHPVFEQRLMGSLKHSIHVAAGIFLKTLIIPAGLLIDDSLLAIRLGIDPEKSSADFDAIKKILPFRYTGVASDNFSRWWARALDEWWFSTVDSKTPPSALPADARVELLKARLGLNHLAALQMPSESAGSRPWRQCAFHLEQEPPKSFPIDPSESVRLTGYTDTSPWLDPLYAALGIALSNRADTRLNGADITRLYKKYVKP